MYNALVKMRNKKGFTLIEMMVVIAIIAILVSILVPVIQTSKNKAKGAVDAANIRTMAAEVATNRVLEKDEVKLLESVTLADSQIIPGSYVLFYVINENEVRAYYCTSLNFSNALRGTVYNSLVAETGKLDSTYDELPSGARLLGSLTPTGTALDSTQTQTKADEEFEELLTDVGKSFLSSLGLPVNEDGTVDFSKINGATMSDVLNKNLDDATALAKIAMVEELVNKYGYSYSDAIKMVGTDAEITEKIKEQLTVDTGDSFGANITDGIINGVIGNVIDDAADASNLPDYSFETYCGCKSTETCSGGVKVQNRNRWTHTITTTWTCNIKSEVDFRNYCTQYGLNPVGIDSAHSDHVTSTRTMTKYNNKPCDYE